MRLENIKLGAFAPSHCVLSMTAIHTRGSTKVYALLPRNTSEEQDATAANLDDPRYRWYLSETVANDAHEQLVAGRELTRGNKGHTRSELAEFIAAIH